MSDEETIPATDPIMQCPNCHHEAPPPVDKNGVPIDPSTICVRCDGCKLIIAYGVPQPRLVIEPHDDGRFIRFSVGDSVTIMEKGLAAAFARNVLSILRSTT